MPANNGGVFLETIVASGVGAYAANNSSSMKGLLWTLAKYVLVIVVVSFILMFFLKTFSTENFVPLEPSPKGDKTVETPAGNGIKY